ncbi:hypothetical protein [Clostridium perfringens]|nr:hypothetical protein [Clostridium perfringens]
MGGGVLTSWEKNVSNIPWQEIGDKFKTAELFREIGQMYFQIFQVNP